MPTKYNKILKYHHGEKSLKAPFMIYLDLESLLKKCTLIKIIQKTLPRKKELNTSLQTEQ